MRVLGLMSGTSADGIDAALCELTGSGASLRAELVAFQCLPYESGLRERILAACHNRADVREVARLNVAVGEAFAGAANAIFASHGKAELIGSHGQTICHLPDEGVTLQIGEPAIIAERTGVTTVSDFRQRDMACGGQGAPLVPYADWVLLRHATRDRVIQNIGGIANCTILPAGAGLDHVRGWDTGPGNMLMDECARELFGLECDENGHLAAQGSVRKDWLEYELANPFFAKPPPKTAGREQFGREFAHQFLENGARRQCPPHDIMAMATALTAYSIVQSLRDFSGFAGDFDLIVGGGGAFNPTLMAQLQEVLPQSSVKTHEDLGMRSDAKEALAFAILAYEMANGVPTNVPAVTGARPRAIPGRVQAV